MLPDLRCGFIVTPTWAKQAISNAKLHSDWHNPELIQRAVAEFINQGHLFRHIHKMRAIYRKRYEALLTAISRHCADKLRVIPIHGGVHVTAILHDNYDAEVVAEKASLQGVSLTTIKHFSSGEPYTKRLIFGIGCIRSEDIEVAIEVIAGILNT